MTVELGGTVSSWILHTVWVPFLSSVQSAAGATEPEKRAQSAKAVQAAIAATLN